ncbi:MAG: BamA/TamA family outer membrane protein [Gemmatimonas sp.]
MCLLAILGTDSLAGQESAPVRPPTGELPPALKQTTRVLRTAFSSPLHLLVDGVASGSGLAGGLGIDIGAPAPWTAKVKGLYSIREYWMLESFARFDGRRVMVEAYARARGLPQVAFYGLGPASALTSRTNFDMRENLVGADASYRVAPWVTMSGRVEQLWIDLNAGRATNLPSIEQVFNDQDAPGLTQQPRFGRYEGALEFEVPASVGEGFLQGLRTRASYARWVDHELGRFSFTRVELEAKQRFAVFRPKHRLTLHAWASTSAADAGQAVPFYLQRTLGGRGQLRSVHEEYLGSDGTRASLRGYDTFRFRGPHLVLLQAEYRIPIWTLLDATVFYDAGKVAAQRSQLNLSNLRQNYGVSVSAMRGIVTAARIDIGLGGEGVQLLFSISTK